MDTKKSFNMVKGRSKYRRLTAKEQVEKIRLEKLIKALAKFCVKRVELYPN
tara:strand:- start:240 stop:392 length:153 start_codon:yes stop_codon:yes gene_type:complete